MKKNVIDWAGEARGTADVVFTRLCNLERSRVTTETNLNDIWNSRMLSTLYTHHMNVEDCVMCLVYKAETEDKKLVDILEEILINRREKVLKNDNT